MKTTVGALALLAASVIALPAQAVETCFGETVTVMGTDGDDNLTASTTDGDDVIWLGAGNDTVDAKGGNDKICMGAGNDTVMGGTGANSYEPGLGDDAITGDAAFGDYVFYTSSASPVVVNLASAQAVGEGTDTLTNIRNVYGSPFNDSLTGTAEGDTLRGEGGNDTIQGGSGDDGLFGGSGNDTILGGPGINVLRGDPGNDSLYGGPDADSLIGHDGDDALYPGGGDNSVDGGWEDCNVDPCTQVDDSSQDAVSYAGYPAGVTVDLLAGTATTPGSDTIKQVENVVGTSHADSLTGDNRTNTIVGGDGNDVINGQGDDDRLIPGPGDDDVDGGSGPGDLLDLSSASDQVTVNLSTGSAKGQGIDHLSTLENVLGTEYDDRLTGSAAANNLQGGEGKDRLFGRQGNDVLNGGGGTDLAIFRTAPRGWSPTWRRARRPATGATYSRPSSLLSARPAPTSWWVTAASTGCPDSAGPTR